jgi:subtilase family serine protease
MFDNTTSTLFSSTINNQSNVTGLADGLTADNTQLNKTFTGSSTKISSNSLQASAQAIATNAFTIQPDLIVNAFSIPTIASSNSYLNFNYTAKNQGTATANTNWTYFYLSTDQNFNANIDTLIGYDSVSSISAGGASSEYASNYISSANVADGNYYVIAQVDGANQVIESNESNNITVSSNTIQIGITNSKPDLTINAFSIPTTASNSSSLNFNYTVKNQGTATANYSYTNFYLSTDQTLNTSNDTYIGVDYVPYIGAGGASSEYASNYLSSVSVASGTYYIIAQADAYSYVIESNESNNITVSSNTVQIGNLKPQPDLIVAPFTIPTTANNTGFLSFNYTVKNQGTASVSFSDTNFYLSTDQTFNATTDTFIGTDSLNGPISAGGASSEYDSNYLSNVLSGTYYIIAIADGYSYVPESNESNNITVSSNTVQVGSSNPDLTINTFSIPTTASNSSYLNFNYTIKNQGTATANYSYTNFYLSTDQTLNTSTDTYIGLDYVTSIGAGGASSEYASNYLSSVASGTYYIIAQADAYSYVSESNESNNITVSSNTVQIGSGNPDLTINAFSIPTTASNSSHLSFNYTIKNQGTATANPSYTNFYLSTDQTLNTITDTYIGYDYVSSIGAGGASSKSVNNYLSSVASGSYYLIAHVDGYSQVTESNESNNITVSSNTVRVGSTSSQPDLTVGSVNIAVNVWNNGYLYSNYTINNQGTTTANPSYTKFYLSTDKTLDTNTDKFIDYGYVGSIAAGGTFGTTFVFNSYASSYNLSSGSYYLIAQADGYNYVTESNESNNITSSYYPTWLT